MGNLGDAVAQGKTSTQNLLTPGTSLWVCSFPPEVLPRDQDFEVYHGSILGPGGYIATYLDNKFYTAGVNGIINWYDPQTPMYVRKGQRIDIVWSIGSGAAPVARLWFRTPEAGRI